MTSWTRIAVTAAWLLLSGSTLTAQQPTTEQVTRALQTRPEVSVEVRQRIMASGLTAEQIRKKYEKALTRKHPEADKVKEKILQLKKLLKQNHPESKRSTKVL